MKKLFQASTLVILLALVSGGVVAQNSNKNQGTDSAKNKNNASTNTNNSSAPQQRGESADKTIALAAQNSGLRTCRPVIDQVSRYLIGNGISSGVLQAAPENANARIVSSSMVIENTQGMTYATTSYSPNGDVACGVSYDAVTYWKESCTELSSKVLRELRPMGMLGNKTMVLDGGPTMRMYLMPAGSGCIQIKKEVIH